MNSASNQVLATALAEADANVQAEVLNDFVAHLRVLCKAGNGNVGTQAYYIAQHLRSEAIEFCREMVGSYDYAREQVGQDLHEARQTLQNVRDEVDRVRKELS